MNTCHEKLDQSKVEYIVAEKRKGSKNAAIAEAVGVSVRYAQKLWDGFCYSHLRNLLPT